MPPGRHDGEDPGHLVVLPEGGPVLVRRCVRSPALHPRGRGSTYGWMTDPQMIDALALGETTPGPLISIGIFVGLPRRPCPGRGPRWARPPPRSGCSCRRSCSCSRPRPTSLAHLPARVKEFLRGHLRRGRPHVRGLDPTGPGGIRARGASGRGSRSSSASPPSRLTFWKWRLNVVARSRGWTPRVLRAFAPGLFGGPLTRALGRNADTRGTPIDDRYSGVREVPALDHARASSPQTRRARDGRAGARLGAGPSRREGGASRARRTRGITLNTVQSAMERLFRKGLLAGRR